MTAPRLAHSRCPTSHRCERCGSTAPPLRVVLRQYATGEDYCLTECPSHGSDLDPTPRVDDLRAGRYVAQHAAHVRGGGR